MSDVAFYVCILIAIILLGGIWWAYHDIDVDE